MTKLWVKRRSNILGSHCPCPCELNSKLLGPPLSINHKRENNFYHGDNLQVMIMNSLALQDFVSMQVGLVSRPQTQHQPQHGSLSISNAEQYEHQMMRLMSGLRLVSESVWAETRVRFPLHSQKSQTQISSAAYIAFWSQTKIWPQYQVSCVSLDRVCRSLVSGIKGWFSLYNVLFTDWESFEDRGFHGAWLSVKSIHISQRQKWQCSCVAVCNVKSLS